ncbi:hypothetical protein NL676_019542 [Syzygium grande]|nr:hypothetical protein NL676_019542 [Syzygium grande]
MATDEGKLWLETKLVGITGKVVKTPAKEHSNKAKGCLRGGEERGSGRRVYFIVETQQQDLKVNLRAWTLQFAGLGRRPRGRYWSSLKIRPLNCFAGGECDSVGHDRASWRVGRFRRPAEVHGHRSGRERKVRRWAAGGVAARVAESRTGDDLDTAREWRHGGEL